MDSTLDKDKWEVGGEGARCLRGEPVGEQIALMGSARLSLCYVVLPAKTRI